MMGCGGLQWGVGDSGGGRWWIEVVGGGGRWWCVAYLIPSEPKKNWRKKDRNRNCLPFHQIELFSA